MSGSGRPLRFGVMVAAAGVTEFARTCISEILKDNLAIPAVLLVDPTTPEKSSRKQKLRKAIGLNGNLWYAQSKLFPPQLIPMYRRQSLDDIFPDIERMVCRPVMKGRFSQYFEPEDVTRIRSLDLDFILKFAFGITRGEVLTAARYGVWSFHHDDEEKYRGGPPAFWEIYSDDPVSGILLQRLTDRLDGGVVLKKSFVQTDRRSYRKNLQRVQFCSTHMARAVCVDILNGVAGYLDGPPSKTDAPIYKAPNDWQMLKFWWRLAGNWLRYKLANQRVDLWNVGLIQASPAQFLNNSFSPEVEWTEYRQPDQMVADPFLLPFGPEPRILVEEFHWFNERGRIAEIRRGPDGRLSNITPVLDEDVHMSYPYTFEHQGTVYCIPETGQAKEVRLYRLGTNGTWSFVCNLLDNVPAVDSTVFIANDRWWLLHSGMSGPGPWSLYVWSAPELSGPWTGHPGNPVKTDIRSARPAGNPFWHEGWLYRPAQDGRNSYGGGLAINRIDVLSMQEFRETTVRYISPDAASPYPDGLHTLSSFKNMCVVDAKKHVWPLGFIASRYLAKKTGRSRRKAFRYSGMSLVPPQREAGGAVDQTSRRE